MVTIFLSARTVSFVPLIVTPSPMLASTSFSLTTTAKDAPMPTLEPFEMLTPPARTAILLLSVASTAMFLPLITESSLTVAVVLASLTSTEIAPAMVALPPLPLTAPARDCAAIKPA